MMSEVGKLRVLQMTAMYPSERYPSLGQFVKTQIESLSLYVEIDLFIVQGLQGFIPYLLSIPRILRVLYTGKHDIVHAHYGTLSSIVKLLYWGKKPIITSYCGDDLLGTISPNGTRTLKSRVLLQLNRALAHRDTHAIAKSEALRRRLSKLIRVSIVPNGVNMIKFRSLDKSVARLKLGIDPSARVVLFPADPNLPVKNYQLFSESLAASTVKDVKVLTFNRNSVSSDDTPFYFCAADLVVFTSLSEGSPNVIKEAMACNCHIYSTPCGDVPWLLEDVEGSQVIQYDVHEWAQRLYAFFHGGNEILSTSRLALEQKGIDLDSIARKIVDIYRASLVAKMH